MAALSLGLLALGASVPAAAQTTKDLAQLRQVFAEGRQLEDNGQWADALEKFKEVAAGKMTPQVRFHIALCEENLGKLVSAKRGFDLAAAEGTAAGSSAAEVPPAAKQHSDAVAERLGKLRVELKGKLTRSTILLDGIPLSPKDLGTDMDADPGVHVVELHDANGAQTFRKELRLIEKGEGRVEVPVHDQEVVPAHTGSSRVPAYVTGAVGAAALIGSGVFFALRASNIATIKATCRDMVNLTGCSPFDAGLTSQGKLYTGMADALVALGVAGLGTGVILFFVLGPKNQSSAHAGTRLAPPASVASLWLAPAGQGLQVGGSF
jgi:hypothetical protein